MTETVYLLRFYGYPISAPVIILSLEGLFLAIPLLWINWLRRRGVFFYTLLALGFTGAAVADWIRSEPISALAFAGVYFYSAQQEFCENCFDLYIVVSRKAVGYDLTTSPSKATTHTYDVYGNLASRT